MGKIKKIHLSEELQDELNTSLRSGHVVWDDFSNGLKKQLLNNTGAGTGSEQTNTLVLQVKDDVDAMQVNKADKTDLAKYVKKGESETVSMDMLAPEVKSKLGGSNGGTMPSDMDTYMSEYLTAHPLPISAFNEEAQQIIRAPLDKISTYDTAIAELQGSINDLKETAGLTVDTNYGQRITDLENNITSILNAISNIRNEIANIPAQLNAFEESITGQNEKFSEMDERITATENAKVGYDRLDDNLKDAVDDVNEMDEHIQLAIKFPGVAGQVFVSDGKESLVTSSIICMTTIAETEEEFAEAKTNNCKDILYVPLNRSTVFLRSLSYDLENSTRGILSNIFKDGARATVLTASGEESMVNDEELNTLINSMIDKGEAEFEPHFLVIDDLTTDYAYSNKFLYDRISGRLYFNDHGAFIKIFMQNQDAAAPIDIPGEDNVPSLDTDMEDILGKPTDNDNESSEGNNDTIAGGGNDTMAGGEENESSSGIDSVSGGNNESISSSDSADKNESTDSNP